MPTPNRLVTVHRIDGRTITYRRPSYREIEMHYRETEGTQFDPVERGAVSGGIPLAWAKVEIATAGPTRNLLAQ